VRFSVFFVDSIDVDYIWINVGVSCAPCTYAFFGAMLLSRQALASFVNFRLMNASKPA
jgi:uncharacterized protein (UPF0212 family)